MAAAQQLTFLRLPDSLQLLLELSGSREEPLHLAAEHPHREGPIGPLNKSAHSYPDFAPRATVGD
jgi:hypothetical protein